MSHASRQLDIGAHVSTDYDHGRQSIHSIVARKLDAGSTSGVVFRVLPDLGGWIDADWFEPTEGFEHRDYFPDDGESYDPCVGDGST